jgi:CBS domain-containing protein
MLAESLISNEIPFLKPSDSISKALRCMSDLKLYHLPFVDQNEFIGLVSENELLEVKDQSTKLGDLNIEFLNSFAFANTHVYHVILLFTQFQVSVVPILDRDKKYLGVVTIGNILAHISKMFAVNEPGGIIVLGVKNRDNSLAHIAQIVESNNAQILSSSVDSSSETDQLELTLKINKTELSSIIATFERYKYDVKAVFNNTQNPGYLSDRFDSLMNYLNV